MTRMIRIFDTTLRDGEQSPGASMNVEEKIMVAKQLARLGVDIIEAGFAYSSPGDFEAVRRIAQEVEGPTICSLARARRAVLMDVSMPEIDGFQLAEMIREHPRCQKTAIIFISAVHMTDIDRLKGYERGAVDYISVPVVPELLRAKVSVFAELHRRAHQLEALNRELEARVAERTDELKHRAEALQQLNGELAGKNQELDAIVKTAPDIIFSRQSDGLTRLHQQPIL